MILLGEVLYYLRPKANWAVYGETYDDIDWQDENETCPTWEEIVAAREPALAAQKLEVLRKYRDAKLAETDWWASSDLTMTQEQIDYRQALRDITNTYTSLDDVIWPIKPE